MAYLVSRLEADSSFLTGTNPKKISEVDGDWFDDS